MILVAVALGGGLGAACRYLVDTWVRARWATRLPWPALPWSTLLINVSASLLLGALAGLAARGQLGPTLLTVAGTGFCGGYSTFSTAAVELVRLLEAGERGAAAGYALASLLLPVLAVTLGLGLLG